MLISPAYHQQITSISPANNQHIASITPSISPAATPSSSSIDLNKLTTTSELLPEWQGVDCSALASIGFREAHIRKIAQTEILTPETLKESINAFAFDLEVNAKAKDMNGPALNYFMGILRKGPYVPPDNYQTPQARQMREYLEAQKRVVEHEERQIQELKEVEFKKWEMSLSSQVIDELIPLGKSEAARRSQLLNHFTDHIWSQRLEAIRAMVKEEKCQVSISSEHGRI